MNPTRATPRSQTIIDQIWYRDEGLSDTSGIIFYNLTDHFPVFLRHKLSSVDLDPRDNFVSTKFRLRNSVRDEIFRAALERFSVDRYSRHVGVNNIYNAFIFDLTNAYNEAYPFIVKKKKRLDIDKPYITPEIKKLIKRKHALQKKYMKFPITYAEEFGRVRNAVTKATNLAKKRHYHELFKSDQCNQKRSWNVIKGILGQDNKGSSITDLNIKR